MQTNQPAISETIRHNTYSINNFVLYRSNKTVKTTFALHIHYKSVVKIDATELQIGNNSLDIR